LLVYLMPHYIGEGKNYLTISFGCTGGHHRSVMIAADIGKRLDDQHLPLRDLQPRSGGHQGRGAGR
jgi:UPF0042 nucleotide-binding protein